MDIVFVGAGRLATNLARALHDAGHRIVAVYSRTQASADALCALVGGQATDSVDALPRSADAFILSVKDSVLASLADALLPGRESSVFLHTAGSIPMSVLGRFPHHGVIYPMQSFSKERQVDFSQVSFFIEGHDDLSLQLARTIAGSVSSHVVELSSEQRRHLHLAAVFACNFVNHCYALSAEVLARQGIAFEAMLPLIDETARKVHEMKPRSAQTGPAVRYDENVIAAQHELLSHDPMMQEIYDLMSKSIHRLAND